MRKTESKKYFVAASISIYCIIKDDYDFMYVFDLITNRVKWKYTYK